MSKRILTITWKPDVLHMVEHKGSKTARSERESYRNVKTREKAVAIVNRRNKKEMIMAKWGESIIYSDK